MAVHQTRWVALALWVGVFSGFPAQANDSSYFGDANGVYSVNNTEIEMVSEKIHVAPKIVHCEFTFKNHSLGRSKVTMGFPVERVRSESSKEKWTASDFQLWVRNKEAKPSFQAVDPSRNKTSVPNYPAAYIWEVTFEPNETVVIKNKYSAEGYFTWQSFNDQYEHGPSNIGEVFWQLPTSADFERLEKFRLEKREFQQKFRKADGTYLPYCETGKSPCMPKTAWEEHSKRLLEFFDQKDLLLYGGRDESCEQKYEDFDSRLTALISKNSENALVDPSCPIFSWPHAYYSRRSYIVQSGLSWRHGKIGSATISFDFPKNVFVHQLVIHPAGYRVEENRIVWQFNNWSPSSDLSVTTVWSNSPGAFSPGEKYWFYVPLFNNQKEFDRWKAMASRISIAPIHLKRLKWAQYINAGHIPRDITDQDLRYFAAARRLSLVDYKKKFALVKRRELTMFEKHVVDYLADLIAKGET